MEGLIALAIVLLMLFLAWLLFFRKGSGAAGTLPAGASPTQAVDRWLTAPTQITVGTPATFIFESLNNNPLAITTPQTTPIVGRTIGFITTPAEIQIVSINGTPVNGSTGDGQTGSPNGQVTVIIVANSLPAPAAGEDVSQGALIGAAAAAPTKSAATKFTIVQ